ncbi:hypothetical protein [Actinokineospora pegani]|uniref:hypothetical protein n=1 Tax=Actinokineospora pegani TaxID=2654637 RepID=UPI0012EA4509|nr:hypothetical protein [Actinokineospora pegani]
MFVFAGVEVLTAVVIASVIPPAWSLPHLLLEVIALGTYVGLGLVWRTTPHELRDDALVIRTGVLGDLVVPLTAVATVRPEPRTSAGFGTRFVDDSTIACSVTSDTNVTITLESAHGFTLKKGGTRQVKHIRLNAEDPRRAAREISAQGSGRACDSGAA